MDRVKDFQATGLAPLGKLYAGDLNAIQDACAALLDFAQTVGLGTLAIGQTDLQLLRYGAGLGDIDSEARLTGSLRTDGIVRVLGGLISGAFTTAQRDAIPADMAPYGLVILNTTTNRYEWNQGTDVARDWQPIGRTGPWDTSDIVDGAVTAPKLNANVAGAINQIGTFAIRPAANSVPAGTRFFATDQVSEYISDGAAWIRVTTPAGVTVSWYKPDAVAPTGWVKYNGTNLPAATGIYAELYAHLGNTLVTPDTSGRGEVGLGTHADVNAIGDNDGIAVGSRRPKHKHTVVQPTMGTESADHIHTVASHSHGGGAHTHVIAGSYADGAGAGTGPHIYNNLTEWPRSTNTNGSGTIISAEAPNTGGRSATHIHTNTGGTVGPQTGAEPTDGAAWITTLKIAKL